MGNDIPLDGTPSSPKAFNLQRYAIEPDALQTVISHTQSLEPSPLVFPPPASARFYFTQRGFGESTFSKDFNNSLCEISLVPSVYIPSLAGSPSGLRMFVLGVPAHSVAAPTRGCRRIETASHLPCAVRQRHTFLAPHLKTFWDQDTHPWGCPET